MIVHVFLIEAVFDNLNDFSSKNILKFHLFICLSVMLISPVSDLKLFLHRRFSPFTIIEITCRVIIRNLCLCHMEFACQHQDIQYYILKKVLYSFLSIFKIIFTKETKRISLRWQSTSSPKVHFITWPISSAVQIPSRHLYMRLQHCTDLLLPDV